LDRVRVDAVVAAILRDVPDADVRLVGTASSVLRGIDLPANDLDILFRDRDGIDASVAALGRHHLVTAGPEWIPDTCQYFARLEVRGAIVELSTVEIETVNDTMECFGAGPWQHFDPVTTSGGSVAAVATELRLLTELARGREDRYSPIVEFLRVRTCDLDLIRRGLADHGIPEAAEIESVARLLGPPSR
jgi:hypothetical protein